MNAKVKDGKALEQLIGIIEKILAANDNIIVELDKKLTDKFTGEQRQFDVVLTVKHQHHTVVIGIECKDRARPVGVPDVEAFHTKCQHAGINQGVIVSTSGFASDIGHLLRGANAVTAASSRRVVVGMHHAFRNSVCRNSSIWAAGETQITDIWRPGRHGPHALDPTQPEFAGYAPCACPPAITIAPDTIQSALKGIEEIKRIRGTAPAHHYNERALNRPNCYAAANATVVPALDVCSLMRPAARNNSLTRLLLKPSCRAMDCWDAVTLPP
jgi:Restriction endonuclease